MHFTLITLSKLAGRRSKQKAAFMQAGGPANRVREALGWFSVSWFTVSILWVLVSQEIAMYPFVKG
jgi:hypothetical protein